MSEINDSNALKNIEITGFKETYLFDTHKNQTCVEFLIRNNSNAAIRFKGGYGTNVDFNGTKSEFTLEPPELEKKVKGRWATVKNLDQYRGRYGFLVLPPGDSQLTVLDLTNWDLENEIVGIYRFKSGYFISPPFEIKNEFGGH